LVFEVLPQPAPVRPPMPEVVVVVVVVVGVVPKAHANGPFRMAGPVVTMEAGLLPITISLGESRCPHHCERGHEPVRITGASSIKTVLRRCIIFRLFMQKDQKNY